MDSGAPNCTTAGRNTCLTVEIFAATSIGDWVSADLGRDCQKHWSSFWYSWFFNCWAHVFLGVQISFIPSTEAGLRGSSVSSVPETSCIGASGVVALKSQPKSF